VGICGKNLTLNWYYSVQVLKTKLSSKVWAILSVLNCRDTVMVHKIPGLWGSWWMAIIRKGCEVEPITRAKAAVVFLVVNLLLPLQMAQAHFPALYGREFVRTGPPAPEEPLPTPLAAQPLSEEDIEAYKKQLEELEGLSGPYAEGLNDSLVTLGRHHLKQKDYSKALELYRRALHVMRVNAGLDSEQQVPLIREMMIVHQEMGDLEGLDKLYDTFFRTHGEGFPPYSDERKRAILEYMRWQRAVYATGLDAGNGRRLVELYSLNERMLEAIGAAQQDNFDWYRELVINQLRNLYLVLGRVSLAGDGFRTQSPELDSSTEGVRQRTNFIQRTGYSTGRNLLEALIAESEQLDPVERAGLYLELGDWAQWNQYRDYANEQYAEVEQILLAASEHERLEKWLGTPLALPDNDAFKRPDHLQQLEEPVVVTVQFDISATGAVRNVELVAVEPDGATNGTQLKRMLRGTHFRPRFVSGQAQAVNQVIREYQLVD
jgi:tetratricopeptide (TPR) repeat protein